jgi:hypothetical protein
MLMKYGAERLPFIQCYDVDSELRENHPSY